MFELRISSLVASLSLAASPGNNWLNLVRSSIASDELREFKDAVEAVEAVETPESVEMSGEIRPVTALSSSPSLYTASFSLAKASSSEGPIARTRLKPRG